MGRYFITVVIPIFNAENYIKKGIESLINQTTEDLEIILVDDGSTDNSGKICDEYIDLNNIKVIHKENGGICSARNVGLSNAEGKYISFMDADDFIDLNAYEKIINVLKNTNADILDFGWRYISDTGEKTENMHENPKDVLLDEIYIKKEILPPLLNLQEDRTKFVYDFAWNKIYKKEIIDQYQIRFDEQRRTWEDRIFIVEFLKYCDNYYCMNECFYNYVSVQESLSRRYNDQYLELILRNYNLYVKLYGEEYDFSTQYAIDYWANSIENMIMQQLRVKDKHPEVIENINKILQEEQVEFWYKHRTVREKIDEEIINYLENGQYELIIKIYEKRLAVIQKEEQRNLRKQRIKGFIRKLIKG